MKSAATKEKYVLRLGKFFNSLNLETSETSIENKARIFADCRKNDNVWAFNSILKFMQRLKDRADSKEIIAGTIRNYVKSIKLFCQMADVSVAWDKITRGLPKGRRYADDRAPTLEEIKRLGYKPKINFLLGSFYAYLVDQEIESRKRIQQQKRYLKYYRHRGLSGDVISWIELLLQTPIDDFRKNTVSLILAPYLVNVKHLAYEETFARIKEWLFKCSKIRRLDPNFDSRIKYSILNAIHKGTRPLRLETLKTKNDRLYRILKENSK